MFSLPNRSALGLTGGIFSRFTRWPTVAGRTVNRRPKLSKIRHLPTVESLPTDNLLHSIFAIHGLNPGGKPLREHAFDTWRKPSGDGGFSWLEHDLPRHAPFARIFLHIYDSTLLYSSTKGDFLDAANALLEEMHLKRMDVSFTSLVIPGCAC